MSPVRLDPHSVTATECHLAVTLQLPWTLTSHTQPVRCITDNKAVCDVTDNPVSVWILCVQAGSVIGVIERNLVIAGHVAVSQH